jgi:hypothetical protein
VINSGGDPYSITSIKNGSLEMTMPQFPSRSVAMAVKSLVDAARGIAQPHYLDDSAEGGYSIHNPLIITKANISKAPTGEYGG